MRRLIKNVFRVPNNQDQHKRQIIPSLSNFTIKELQRKAKIGFIANKIGEYFNVEKEDRDALFFSAFSGQEQFKGQSDFLSLAESLLSWIEKDVDVLKKVQALEITSETKNYLINVYKDISEQITPNIQTEMRIEQVVDKALDPKWKIYRDVMYAVTQKKFLLLTKEEVEKYRSGNILCQGEIKDKSCIPICRDLAKKSLQDLGISSRILMSWLLIISEAITNTIKHAEEGKMTLIEEGQIVRIIVEDKGSGFDLEDLPNTVLMAGYSTKKSLGQGFTLMMKMAEQVLLSTGSQGSTIILIFKKEGETNDSPQSE